MKVILGLGNPGKQYEATRHNVGWWVLDHLADVWRFNGWKKDGLSQVSSGVVNGSQVKLVKPQTYMNLSGQALRPFLRKEGWKAPNDLLVIVDDVAFPVGRYRLRARGSAGGHNGLRDIERELGNQDYPRMRIGVGPDPEHKRYEVLSDFVLGPFAKAERETILALMPNFTDAVETWLRDGITRAMNTHNAQE